MQIASAFPRASAVTVARCRADCEFISTRLRAAFASRDAAVTVDRCAFENAIAEPGGEAPARAEGNGTLRVSNSTFSGTAEGSDIIALDQQTLVYYSSVDGQEPATIDPLGFGMVLPVGDAPPAVFLEASAPRFAALQAVRRCLSTVCCAALLCSAALGCVGPQAALWLSRSCSCCSVSPERRGEPQQHLPVNTTPLAQQPNSRACADSGRGAGHAGGGRGAAACGHAAPPGACAAAHRAGGTQRHRRGRLRR